MKRQSTIITIAVSAVSALLGSIFFDWYKNFSFIDKVILFFREMGNMMKSFLLYQTPLWVVILSLLGIISLIFLIWYIRRPNFIAYRTDNINGLIWRWNWKLQSKGWDIVELTAHCPKDETPLTHEGRCPRCGLLFPACDKHFIERVCILIKDNAFKKYLKSE